ncbi:riboflavin synthase [Nemorincola caseinilytica]|uniref:Riboflavin synthase n=1 Tax=Nemorincola caseinilytica TaxID=2054315 RepID=A0ABP8NES8_9BACT
MFTGIIEALATVAGIRHEGSNIHFVMRSAITTELKIDQSVAHNGVCLTVVAIEGDTYTVTAVAETLAKTNLGKWAVGQKVNLERSLRVGDRLDGHFVQGHADATATCIEKRTLDGSWLFRFRFPERYAALVIEKGSICINGVSLTVFDVGANECTVTIIPYTYEHTNFGQLEAGDEVNIEFDVLGKYMLRMQQFPTGTLA